MKNQDPNKHTDEPIVQPDPETTGSHPEEHMDGPVSTLVRKVAEGMADNDQENHDQKERQRLREEEEARKNKHK